MNNNKYKILWITLICLLLMNISLMLWLWFSSPIRHEANRPFFLENELNLNDIQIEKYRKMRSVYFEKKKHLQDSIKINKEAFLRLVTKNLTADEIHNESMDIEANAVEINILTYEHLHELYEMCNTEQREKFEKIINKIAFQMSKPPLPPRPPHGKFPPPPDAESR